MNSKIITAIGATSLVLGMFALQGCFESSYPGYGGGYGYGSGPAYYSTPVYGGDYDEHRSWWGGNHRDRDEDRHEASRNNSERNEHEEHANRDHDHDRD
jgi:hypothetical protein